MGHYTMLSKYGNCNASAQNYKQAKNRPLLQIKVGKNSRHSVGVFNKTIIPLELVGYEMNIANSYPTRTRGIIVN